MQIILGFLPIWWHIIDKVHRLGERWGVDADRRLHEAGDAQVPAHLLDGVEVDHKGTILHILKRRDPLVDLGGESGMPGGLLRGPQTKS